jgi:hypothetical protein
MNHILDCSFIEGFVPIIKPTKIRTETLLVELLLSLPDRESTAVRVRTLRNKKQQKERRKEEKMMFIIRKQQHYCFCIPHTCIVRKSSLHRK